MHTIRKKTGGRNFILLNYASGCLIFCLSVSLLFGNKSTANPEDPLTPVERAWYMKNKDKITLSLYTEFAPYEFLDSSGNPTGFSEEVIQLIEKKLQISFKRKYYKTWQNILNDVQQGKIQAIQTIHNTAQRRKYLYFTNPYISVPNAIIVRKDWKGEATVAGLAGKKVAIVKGYASFDYVKRNNPALHLVPVMNDATGLKELAFHNVDAYIMNLEVVTYYLRKMGITNLRIGDNIKFRWNLCIGVAKNMPLLHTIFQKGLLLISEEEIKRIHNKWITIEAQPFYKMRGFQLVAGGSTAFFILILSLISIWNRILAKKVAQKTSELQESHENLELKVKERTAELTAALSDIKELKGLMPICSRCKKIRDDDGYWSQVDEYLIHHTDALVSHSLCPQCSDELYGEEEWYQETKKELKDTDE